ncbi:hypothetical protein TrispH2_011876, partial [Trichoplax sp. H2]
LQEKEYYHAYTKALNQGHCYHNLIRGMFIGPPNVGKSSVRKVFTQQSCDWTEVVDDKVKTSLDSQENINQQITHVHPIHRPVLTDNLPLPNLQKDNVQSPIVDRWNDTKDEANSLQIMAVCRSYLGQHKVAFTMLNNVLYIRLALLSKNHAHIADTYEHMGDVGSNNGDYQQAISKYNLSLDMRHTILKFVSFIVCYSRIRLQNRILTKYK